MTARRAPAALAVLALVPAVGGCGLVGGDDGVDREQANAALEQQRTEALALARVLLDGAEEALPGAASSLGDAGQWRGCESASLEEFRDFRYQLSARVDVAPSATVREPYLGPLGPVMADAGLDPERVVESNGFTSLRASQGDLTVQFVHTEAGRFVLLQVVGECVDVAEEDRDDWLRRDGSSPPPD